ncbi:hypothetical protein HOE37_04500 [Candidatus Woesearchaeota archaeon]|jgi:hypothetical protein|nr:hypothetical protein [Candidatus Woesearchaeota archaeon]MBT4111092.1 hypothetical protein [Candidatus Woesearchaeota archaeon]MBT4335736.1 hypothetical protein [Candidatus Woesearchaeota archaeon]MBT4469259.1 hypothetical protein [Candidatus Woesearchaeota archaeon]MBT6744231.1 hypothetical protein [Candidatus Woesearchaeota archaeon]
MDNYQQQQSVAQQVQPTQTQQIEQPLYVLQQNKKRALIPKITTQVVLGAIFYLGVLLNISLLKLSASSETVIKLVALILLLLIVIVGIFLAFHQANLPYRFYRNRIKLYKKEVLYVNIINTNPKIDFWDKFFKTYSIKIAKDKYIRNIPQTVQISNYLQQLINYAKNSTSSQGNFQ